jgi:hypothetical protein
VRQLRENLVPNYQKKMLEWCDRLADYTRLRLCDKWYPFIVEAYKKEGKEA